MIVIIFLKPGFHTPRRTSEICERVTKIELKKKID
jgi:hypothetical protein